jgi:hypothetical protein
MSLEWPTQKTEALKPVEEMETGQIAESLEQENDLESKTDFKTIEIPGVGQIRYHEKTINFPSRLIEETGGVLGYKRKLIRWEDLCESIGIESSLVKNENFSFQTFLDEMSSVNLICNSSVDKLTPDAFEKYERMTGKKLTLINNKEIFEKNVLAFYKVSNDNIKTLLKSLTNNEFISETFNHVMDGHTTVEGSVSSFKNNGMLLQEVGSLDLLKQGKGGFSYNIFDKETNKLIPFVEFISTLSLKENVKQKIIDNFQATRERSPQANTNLTNYYLKDLSKDEKQVLIDEIIKRNDVYLASFFGLSVTQRDRIWNQSLKKTVFGFGKNNKAFSKHNEDVKNLFQKIQAQYDTGYGSTNELTENVEHVQGGGRSSNLLSGSLQTTELLLAKNWEYFMGDPDDDFNFPIREDLDLSQTGHLHIPIVHNHPDISKLKWCLTDYAAIPTQSGYNIIEMITNKEAK